MSETHHQLQGNPKHDAQGMEPKRPTPPPSAPRRRLAAKRGASGQKSRQKGTEEAKPSALQEVNKQHLKTGNLKQKRNTEALERSVLETWREKVPAIKIS